MKKLKLLLMCFALMMLFAGCGAVKEDTKWIEESAAMIDTELTSGQFVLDGVVYTFPMELQFWLDNGWHISNNYENKDEFILDAGSGSNEFELFNEEGDYVRVSVMNTTDEGIKIEKGFVCSLYLPTTEVDVVLPQGMTKRNKPAEVVEAYGEPDSKNVSGETYDVSYLFASESEYQCSVTIDMVDNSYTIDPMVSIDYMILSFDQFWNAWVENDGEEKAINYYFDTVLKACFRGELDDYVSCCLDSRDGAEELYEYEMRYYAECLAYYMNLEPSYLDEATMNRFEEVAKKVLVKANWKVKSVEVGKFNEATVTMELYPTDFKYLIEADLTAALESFYTKYADVDVEVMSDAEYAEFEQDYIMTVLEVMEKKADAAGTLEPVSLDIEFNLGIEGTLISDESWAMIDGIIMDIYYEE